MLHIGSNGEDVQQWQSFLVGQGLLDTADGNFGPKTKAATEAFQINAGLEADGVVGEATTAAATLLGFSSVNTIVEPVPTPFPTTRRKNIVDAANAAVDKVGPAMAPFLGPRPTTCTWESLLDEPFICKDGKVISGISTCGIFAEACLGCGPESLRKPYIFGTAIARIMNFARTRGALRTTGTPALGDYVCVHNSRGGEHVFIVTGCDGDKFTTVEAGQALAGDNWLQSIRRRMRRLIGKDFGGNPLAWFVDVDKL